MSARVRASRLFASLLLIVVASLGAGCTVVRSARGGDGGKDPTPIQPGTTRAAAEVITGSPLREWTSTAGLRYRLYQYDAGCPPNLLDAAGGLFADVLTFGLLELFDAVHRWRYGTGLAVLACSLGRNDERVVLAYDDRDVVIGIFDELDELPADGRSGPRTWPR